MALGDSLGDRGVFGVSTGLAGRIHLGRRSARDQTRDAFLARIIPYLVRFGRHSTVLPAIAQHLLDRAQAMGRRAVGLSPREHLNARHGGLNGGGRAAPARGSRRVPGRGHFRSAPGAGGIGGMDHGTQKHPFRLFLSIGSHALPSFRPKAEEVVLRGGTGFYLCLAC